MFHLRAVDHGRLDDLTVEEPLGGLEAPRKHEHARISHGIHARTTKLVACFWNLVGAMSALPLSASWPLSAVVVQISFGFQTLKNTIRQAIDIERRPDIHQHRTVVIRNQKLRDGESSRR